MSSPEKSQEEGRQSILSTSSPTNIISSSTSSLDINDAREAVNRDLEYGPDISRTTSRREETIARIRSRSTREPFTHALSNQKTGEDVIVRFDGKDDPYNPLNWPFGKKIVTTMLYGFTTMGATWASAVYAPAVTEVSRDYNVSKEVSTLGVSLFLFGFGLGPLLWAPLSEVYGRRLAVFWPYFIAAAFSFGTGAAKDIQTILITRFFAGFFGSAPVSNTGGVLNDIWSPEHRGSALVAYALAVVGGPVFGPIAGGAFVESSLGWRWTQYITGILMMFTLCLDVILLDESYAPVLLVYKARRLRYETGNWSLHAKHEEWDLSFKELAVKYLIRPFQMLSTPICFLVALYASFCYGILYSNLGAYPIAFQEERGWNAVVGALPFLAFFVGVLGAAAVNLYNQRYYVKQFQANNCRAVPEARLPPMMFGSVFFAGGMFLFAWTSSKEIHWILPIIGSTLLGLGFFTIFQAALNYLVDTFHIYAASAIAANTFLRGAFAGAFPLFISPLLHKLGIGWGVSIFAFFAVLLIPIPFLFFIYGKRIRARGVWSRDSL